MHPGLRMGAPEARRRIMEAERRSTSGGGGGALLDVLGDPPDGAVDVVQHLRHRRLTIAAYAHVRARERARHG
jgi:hypothetical protein